MSKLKLLVAIGIPVFLILGLFTGLSRFGVIYFPLSFHHGVLMLNGFAGGVITVERLLSNPKDRWFHIGLILLTAGLVLYLLGFEFGLLLVSVNVGILFLKETLQLVEKQSQNGVYQLVGLLSWFIGNLKFYQNGFYPAAVPFWIVFILMLIVGTPLIKNGKKDVISLILALTLFFSFWLGFHSYGQTIYGIGLVLLSIRLGYLELKNRSKHLLGVVIAYTWLMMTGISLLFSDHILYSYDLVLHAFFLGFFFSMIFINAPDALLKKLGLEELKTFPNFWLVFLSIGLIARLIIGDLFQIQLARSIGGTLNLLTIILYAASLLFQAIRNRTGAERANS
ncbi:hypothetical protein [Ekhidna sp.]|jgi:hypothetical protein|uniref:hypothetical protein n=1 Tax=Ekhidna sp. TaxID=2608089 RepID=UPI0032F02DB5